MTERDLFIAALKITEPAERSAWLDRECGDVAALRQRIDVLLQAFDKAGSLLEAPIVAGGPTINQPTSELAGTVIGPYKLLQQIGEGGMGTVFMAEQTQPVQRKVALKIIKPGMDSRQVIARFEAERQALAMMDHVNIARVLDAGATEAGRPYFVMELVHGVPITKYCDDNHLTPRERLELFVPVCQAIQHAHQKGIIHRDIKPSNVMVTLYDGKPVPKVIDFGVAKATEQKLTERTLFTQYGTMVGTLEYMSPEQAEMSALGVDTRSDIFSLGVLLYELLTGSTPLTRKQLKEAAYGEILRLIREEEPPKPSTRLSDSGGALALISASRNMEPAKLSKLVRGELDWIVMKTLEKDRNRRYETANALASDVQRYLADETVQACPPSTWYRFRKFGRRHKMALVLGGLIVGVLIVAAIDLGISNALIRQEKKQTEAALEAEEKQHRRAEANMRLALRSLEEMYTELAQERLANRPDLKPLQREFLQKALTFYESFARENTGEPAVLVETAKAYRRVGNIQQEFGALDKVEPAYRRAIASLQEISDGGNPSPECVAILAGTQNDLAVLLTDTGKFAEAESAHAQAVALMEKLAADHPETPQYREDLARWLGGLGRVMHRVGRYPEALRVRQRSVDLLTELVRAFPGKAGYRHNLAIAFMNLGVTQTEIGREKHEARRPLAEESDRKAKAILEKLVAESPAKPVYRQDLALAGTNLGADLQIAGKLKDAEPLYRESAALYQKLVDDFPQIPDHQHELARCQGNLGLLLEARGNAKEAEQAHRQAIAAYEKLAAAVPGRRDYSRGVINCRLNLAILLENHSRYAEADREYRQNLEQHPNNPNIQNPLAWLLANCPDAKLRRPAEAVALAQSVVQQEEKSTTAWTTLGAAQYRVGKYADSIKAMETAIKLEAPSDSLQWLFLAMAESKQGHDAQARQWFERAAAWMEKYKDRVNLDARARMIFPPLYAEAEQVVGGKGNN